MGKLKTKIENLGLSYNKEISILVFINFLIIAAGAAVIYFSFSLIAILAIVLVLMIFNYLFLSRYTKLVKKQKEDSLDDFVKIITYLEIFISNGCNVYGAIKKAIPFASSWNKFHLEKLVSEIDNDKSIKPFIDFAANYEGSVVENVMISIYQMIDDGENSERLLQFKFVFDRFYETHIDNKVSKKTKSLDSLNVLPLLGAGIVMIMVVVGVISIIGDLINVL